MRKFVESIRTVFRKKKPGDDDNKTAIEGGTTTVSSTQQGELVVEPNGTQQAGLSCARKKKKATKTANREPEKRVTTNSNNNSTYSITVSTVNTVNTGSRRDKVTNTNKSTMAPPPSKMDPPPKSKMSPAPKTSSIRASPNPTPSPATGKRVQKKESSGNLVVKTSPHTTSRTQRTSSQDSGTGEMTRSQRSMRKIKDFSQRTLRKVKTFVSRPIKEATLNKVAERVKTRKTAEQPEKLTHGEDCFPKMQRRNSSLTPRKKNSGSEVFPNVQSTYQTLSPDPTTSSRMAPLTLVKNNDNNGELFIDKNGSQQPFWTKTRRPTEKDLEDSDTDDELQLNSEVVLDVVLGKTKLTTMPSIPVVLDPYNEIKDLRRRDHLFFNRDVLFGNTVRTMINLSDAMSMRSKPRKRDKREPLVFNEPNTMKSYKEGNWSEFEDELFTPPKSK